MKNLRELWYYVIYDQKSFINFWKVCRGKKIIIYTSKYLLQKKEAHAIQKIYFSYI